MVLALKIALALLGAVILAFAFAVVFILMTGGFDDDTDE